MDLRTDEDRHAPNRTSSPPGDLAVTVDLGVPPAVLPEFEPSVEASALPVAVVEGSSANLSTETRALLRARLRAAGLILLVVFGLFLLRRIVGILVFHASGAWRLIGFHILLTVGLGGAVALLSSKAPLSLRALRAVEIAMFGLVVLYLGSMQYGAMLHQIERNDHQIERNDRSMLLVLIKNTMLYTFMIITVYGTFIPNTWRRAAVMVFLISVAPLVVQLLLSAMHPELVALGRRSATFGGVSENILLLLSAVVIAIYGTHTINALRVEAFEARRLGQYQLGDRIGAGGMGEVYLAEHQLLKRPCAIKLIRPSSAADPTAMARFVREVRTTARLSHPNTIEIYDYGRTEDGLFYYVMEYLRGLSLADLVERHGPLPAGRVIYLLRQACEALSEAHAAGLIHRDLKPANIFAAERGGRYDFVKLLDFGLVKPMAASQDDVKLSREGSIAGSPLFMAPEQATGERLPDARSDLYALGAIAYFLLTGRAPFEAKTAFQVIIAHARDPVPPPSRLRPDVPEDLEHVVLRCLAKSPAERFASAHELERALASCAAGGDWDVDRARVWWREHPALPQPHPRPVLASA
jgi:serine/threonine-protein kinase